MPSITIKNIPDRIYVQIKRSAKLNYRSINAEIIYRLQNSLEHKPKNVKQIIKEIEEIQANSSMPKLTDDFLRDAKNTGRP
ncbi:MAG: Arc family DNA-binding protein [Calditrichaceae bacterium]|jgi:antitoxin FitA